MGGGRAAVAPPEYLGLAVIYGSLAVTVPALTGARTVRPGADSIAESSGQMVGGAAGGRRSSHGPGEFGAPDEQERDGDGGQSHQPANPQRPLESAGERGRGGVSLAEKQAGVGRCDGRGDR